MNKNAYVFELVTDHPLSLETIQFLRDTICVALDKRTKNIKFSVEVK